MITSKKRETITSRDFVKKWCNGFTFEILYFGEKPRVKKTGCRKNATSYFLRKFCSHRCRSGAINFACHVKLVDS